MEIYLRYVLGHYIVRQNLNFAILEIANPPKTEFDPLCKSGEDFLNMSTINTDPQEISHPEIVNPNKLDWSSQQYGTMLGAFYYGYCAGMIPGGLMAQRFGFFKTIAVVTFSNGILTFLYPMAIYQSYELGIVLRVLLGQGQKCDFIGDNLQNNNELRIKFTKILI